MMGGDLFSDKPTELLGETRRQLLKKIQTYKHLFSDIIEIKRFKIKRKPTEEDLQNAINEIDAIINCNSVDSFITESIYSSIKVMEGVSKVYAKNYDISGMSDMLKKNPQFNSILKQLFIKYNTFAQVPPETQAVFIIITTSYLCIQSNKQKSAINQLLDEPIVGIKL